MTLLRILGIETSCDETGIALVEASGTLRSPRFSVVKNALASQVETHRPFGGVVPHLAKREHLRNLPLLFGKLFGISNFQFPRLRQPACALHAGRGFGGQAISKQIPKSKLKFLTSIDVIAVTVAPGLEPCLWAGIEFAKQLYTTLKPHNPKLKLVGAHHMEGHLYSFLLKQKREISNFQFPISKKMFPAIALLVSGGHTLLLLMKDLVHYQKLGETRDDAVGEAFDKVARLLELPYPGGPEIETLAKRGNPNAIVFPRPMLQYDNYDFSYSGLKTSVLYYLRDAGKGIKKADVAASFQRAAFDVLVSKTLRAAQRYGAQSILLAGGVAANRSLRTLLRIAFRRKRLTSPLIVPGTRFCTDNGAMIAAAAYLNILQKRRPYRLEAKGTLSM